MTDFTIDRDAVRGVATGIGASASTLPCPSLSGAAANMFGTLAGAAAGLTEPAAGAAAVAFAARESATGARLAGMLVDAADTYEATELHAMAGGKALAGVVA